MLCGVGWVLCDLSGRDLTEVWDGAGTEAGGRGFGVWLVVMKTLRWRGLFRLILHPQTQPRRSPIPPSLGIILPCSFDLPTRRSSGIGAVIEATKTSIDRHSSIIHFPLPLLLHLLLYTRPRPLTRSTPRTLAPPSPGFPASSPPFNILISFIVILVLAFSTEIEEILRTQSDPVEIRISSIGVFEVNEAVAFGGEGASGV